MYLLNHINTQGSRPVLPSFLPSPCGASRHPPPAFFSKAEGCRGGAGVRCSLPTQTARQCQGAANWLGLAPTPRINISTFPPSPPALLSCLLPSLPAHSLSWPSSPSRTSLGWDSSLRSSDEGMTPSSQGTQSLNKTLQDTCAPSALLPVQCGNSSPTCLGVQGLLRARGVQETDRDRARVPFWVQTGYRLGGPMAVFEHRPWDGLSVDTGW